MLCWLLVLHIVLLEVMSQAPGDHDSFCTSLSASVTPPSYPPNSKILMHSFNYINLIPVVNPQAGVWQQVDVDGAVDDSGAASNIGLHCTIDISH